MAEAAAQDAADIALIRNISESGALALTRTVFEAGEKLELSIQTSVEPADTIDTTGEVVRSEEMDPERTGMWRYKVAIHFDKPLKDHAKELDALAELAAKSGLPTH